MQVFRSVFGLCAAYMLLMLAVAQLIPEIFAGLFVQGTENIALAAAFIRKYTIGLLGVAVQYAFVDGLVAMGKVRWSLLLSLFRKFLYIVCVLVLPMVTSLENIFYAGTISDVLGASFTLICFYTRIASFIKMGK